MESISSDIKNLGVGLRGEFRSEIAGVKSEFKSEIGRLDAKIEGLGEVMVKRFEDVDNKLDGIGNRLDKVVDDVRIVSMHVGLDLSKAR